MAFYIVHSSIDENSKISGGKLGDNSGKEVCVRTYYVKPWDMVLRYKDSSIGKKAREIAIKLANSNLVGYDQGNRNSLYKELEKNNWDVDKYIASGVKTESDCSSFVYAVYCCLIPSIRGQANAPTTSTAKNFYTSRGFSLYTTKEYTTLCNRLEEGDLLNSAGKHIVMFIGVNSCITDTEQEANNIYKLPKPTLKKGSKSDEVKYLQEALNSVMNSKLNVDGIFGSNTQNALISFQKKVFPNNSSEWDGVYGSKTSKKLSEYLNCNKKIYVLPTPTLKKGSKSDEVKYLQEALNYVMNSNLTVDGSFGSLTQNAVISFQKKAFPNNSSEWDGIYGTKTSKKLAEYL